MYRNLAIGTAAAIILSILALTDASCSLDYEECPAGSKKHCVLWHEECECEHFQCTDLQKSCVDDMRLCPNADTICLPDQTLCRDGSCSYIGYCSCEVLCWDGSCKSGHVWCPERCPSFQNECTTGTDCYSDSDRCDGYRDCNDGSDEEGCPITSSVAIVAIIVPVVIIIVIVVIIVSIAVAIRSRSRTAYRGNVIAQPGQPATVATTFQGYSGTRMGPVNHPPPPQQPAYQPPPNSAYYNSPPQSQQPAYQPQPSNTNFNPPSYAAPQTASHPAPSAPEDPNPVEAPPPSYEAAVNNE